MPHSFGLRARTRYLFARKFRTKGSIPLSTYLINFKVGDVVDIKGNGAIHKGMPHKFYHGKTGIVYNVTPHAVGIIVHKRVGHRYIEKRVNIRIEHIRKSRSREGFLKRVKENELKRKEAKEKGVFVSLKREPTKPKGARFIKVTETNAPETLAPLPFEQLV
ncbi:60S ribosomal protein L21-A [Hyaloraphidium curvatum]|nr:60S ribosomal protein L21-A [Hyaloraphidium curvatum]